MALKKKRAVQKKPAKKKTLKKAPQKKRITKKKPAKRARLKVKAGAKVKSSPKAKKENIAGKVTHYFPHVQAAVIKLKAPLAIGDKIRVKGHTTDFTQTITSMQIDRVDITSAKPGEEIGLLVTSRVRQHDTVSKV